MRNSTREWINAADLNLECIKAMELDINTVRQISHNAQQTIEKSFKSVIYEYNLNRKYIYVNNLLKLMKVLETVINFDIDIKLIEKLDKHFDESDYSSEELYSEITVKEASEYVELAKKIYEEVIEL